VRNGGTVSEQGKAGNHALRGDARKRIIWTDDAAAAVAHLISRIANPSGLDIRIAHRRRHARSARASWALEIFFIEYWLQRTVNERFGCELRSSSIDSTRDRWNQFISQLWHDRCSYALRTIM